MLTENQTMSDIKILVKTTPNPNAKKFVINQQVKDMGKVAFGSSEETTHIPLAHELFHLPNVTELYFFDNFITVTQNGLSDWHQLSELVTQVIQRFMPNHDPYFLTPEEQRRTQLPPELVEIEEILDRTIRPGLQADGGDIEIVELDGDTLTVRYEGACGSCPSATTGTLDAIQHILREEYRESLEVCVLGLEDW